MDENLRKFSKMLTIIAVIATLLSIGLAMMQHYVRDIILFAFILFYLLLCGFLFLNINVKIKTIIAVPLLIIPIVLVFVETSFSSFLMFFPYIYPTAMLLLVNSWLREIAHLDHPSKKRLTS